MSTLKQQLQDFLDAFILAATAAGISVADADGYYTLTHLEGVITELAAQIGGDTSATYNFTENNVLADNDAIYAALQKLDLKFGDLAETGSGKGATLIGIYDTGAHFSVAESNLEAAVAKLAKTIVITFPTFTGWTKDDTYKTPVLPLIESPVAIRVKRAYIAVGTAPGSGKTLSLKVNGTAAGAVVETATTAEDEALDIAIAKDTDIVLTCSETTSGAGANCMVMLVCQVDDGE